MDQAVQKRLDTLHEVDAMRIGLLEQAIKKGAALLDSKVPGWATNINVSRLDMRSPKDNLLAQLRTYVVGREQEKEYGFYWDNTWVMEDGMSNWAWLKILWKEEITTRL